jgi:hypothetical protein
MSYFTATFCRQDALSKEEEKLSDNLECVRARQALLRAYKNAGLSNEKATILVYRALSTMCTQPRAEDV